MNNVVCVWAGEAYSEEYVKRLSSIAHLYTTKKINFICFTDRKRQPIEGVEFRYLPQLDIEKLWWYKVYIFSKESGLSGDCLYLDLDLVIVKTLDPFLEHTGDFVILQDFNRVIYSNYKISNSSIIKWKHEKARYIWDKFLPNIKTITKQFRGDQDYITNIVGANKTWWPKRLACSYKWEWLQTEEFASPHIIVFHGNPKPEDFNFELTKMIEDKRDRIGKNKIYR